MDETKLILKAKKKDRLSMTRLYEAYQHQWYSLCMRYQKNQSDACDVLQEAVIRVFQNIKAYDPEKGEFGGWAYRVVLNENLQHLRKAKRNKHEDLEQVFDLQDNRETALERVSAQELTALIQQLPAGYRTVFNLYVIEGYGHKEVADQLGISEGTSKSQLSKAKAMLRRKLEILNTA
jgi:RNA polymerase sigma-70 factor (ECF subfamily)